MRSVFGRRYPQTPPLHTAPISDPPVAHPPLRHTCHALSHTPIPRGTPPDTHIPCPAPHPPRHAPIAIPRHVPSPAHQDCAFMKKELIEKEGNLQNAARELERMLDIITRQTRAAQEKTNEVQSVSDRLEVQKAGIQVRWGGRRGVPSHAPGHSRSECVCVCGGGGQGCIGRGGGTPPPSRAPSLFLATVPLKASARLNGICNRQ